MTFNRAALRELLEHLGPARLEEILLRFYERQADDVLIGFFFADSSREGALRDLRTIARKQGQFMLRSAGLVALEFTRPPNKAHSELPPILEGHFQRRLFLLRETLRAEGLKESDINLWVSFEESFKTAVLMGASRAPT
jgi:truncated hemoglobin YjbI